MNKLLVISDLISLILISLILSACNETQDVSHNEFFLPEYCKQENAIIYDPENYKKVEIDKDDIMEISIALEGAKKIIKKRRGSSYYQIGFGDSLKPGTPTVHITGKNTFSFDGVHYQKENIDFLDLTSSIVKEGRSIPINEKRTDKLPSLPSDKNPLDIEEK